MYVICIIILYLKKIINCLNILVFFFFLLTPSPLYKKSYDILVFSKTKLNNNNIKITRVSCIFDTSCLPFCRCIEIKRFLFFSKRTSIRSFLHEMIHVFLQSNIIVECCRKIGIFSFL